MNTFKRAKIVMLPTKERSNLYIKITDGYQGLDYHPYNKLPLNTWHKPQHLYIISDDEIKEDDWYLDDTNQIRKAIVSEKDWKNSIKPGYIICKKIIATTDTSLNSYISESVNKHNPFPQPSQSFIQVFIEEYNKGNVITDVMVEYIIGQGYENGEIQSIKEHLYIKSDNTITIRKIKDSWNREEVEILIRKAIDVTYSDLMEHLIYDDDEDHIVDENAVNEWIKDNL